MMRRSRLRAMPRAAAVLLVATALVGPARAQSGAPHAWLFGAWAGGLFPVAGKPPALACLGQPSVIFTRDVVLRARLTDPLYAQRAIETARATGGQTEFRFSPSVDPLAANNSGLLGLDPPPAAPGFGCETDDVLHVRRVSENVIEFPGCKDFPNPLVRCPAR